MQAVEKVEQKGNDDQAQQQRECECCVHLRRPRAS
jgi:hypothetical protein